MLDLDGTLYNKAGLSKRMVRRLWWCLPMMAIDRLSRGGRCWRWIVSTRWHREVYLATMAELIGQYQPRRENVLELVAECHQRQIPIAIYSDYGAVAEKLNALKVDPKQFDRIITAPDLGGLKPTKVCAQRVLELMNAQPETTLFIGDRDEKDGAAARSVGARFLHIQ